MVVLHRWHIFFDTEKKIGQWWANKHRWFLSMQDTGCTYSVARAESDGTRTETRFRLFPKWTSPFKPVGASVQSTVGSRVVRISGSNAGYTTFGGGVRVLATHSIRQFPLQYPSRASPCATRFRKSYTHFFFNGLNLIWNYEYTHVSR
jgi:hypothetical protein